MTRGFSSLHPLTCFLYYVGVAALVMLHMHPVFLFCGLAVLVFLNIVHDYGRSLRRWGAGFLFLCLFFMIMNPLFNHRGNHILFYFGDNPITLEAVINGITLALSLLCLLVMFVSFNLVIVPAKFLFLFAKIAPQWALLAMLAIRFVPLLKRRLNEIETVQQTKEISLKNGSLRDRAKSGMLLVQILLTWSLEEALQTADSMKARGYGLKERSKYIPYKWKMKDWLALGYMIFFGVISVAGWKLGYSVLQLLPSLEPVMLYGFEWLYLFVFLAYLSLPLLVEGGVQVKWLYWKWTA